MSVNNQYNKVAYGLSDALLNVFPAPIISNRAPTTADKAPLGTVWDYKSANAVYILTSIVNNLATWTNLSGGAGSFSSLTVNPGNLTVTTGDAIVSSGDLIVSDGTIAAGTGIMSETGDVGTQGGDLITHNINLTTAGARVRLFKDRALGPIVTGDTIGSVTFEGYDGASYVESSKIVSVSSGTIAANRVASNLLFYTHPDSTSASTLRMTIAPAGNITVAAPDTGVALTITAGGMTISAGNFVSTLGNITASAGQVVGATIVATGDVAGAASQTAITNVINTSLSSGTLAIKSTTANAGNSAGFIKIYIGGVANFIPYFTNIAP